MLNILWVEFFVIITTAWGFPRPSNPGIIVPPTGPHNAGVESLYDPTGKRPAVTHLPLGVHAPSELLYGKGKVVAGSQKKPAANSGKIVDHQSSSSGQSSSQQVLQQRPSSNSIHSGHLGIANFISLLLGGTTSQNPLAAFGDLPSNADVNVQVIQPFYAHRPASNFFYQPMSGARPMGLRPQKSFSRPVLYGSYPQPFNNQRDFAGSFIRLQAFMQNPWRYIFLFGNAYTRGYDPDTNIPFLQV